MVKYWEQRMSTSPTASANRCPIIALTAEASSGKLRNQKRIATAVTPAIPSRPPAWKPASWRESKKRFRSVFECSRKEEDKARETKLHIDRIRDMLRTSTKAMAAGI